LHVNETLMKRLIVDRLSQKKKIEWVTLLDSSYNLTWIVGRKWKRKERTGEEEEVGII